MSGELTKEQLLEYVKKQKLKIKKLETELGSLKEKSSELPPAPSAQSVSDEVGPLRMEIESLEKQLASKESEITLLSKTIEDAEDEKLKSIAAKNAEIADLIKKNEELSVSSSLMKSLESKIVDQAQEIERLVQKNEEAEACKKELDEHVLKVAALHKQQLEDNAKLVAQLQLDLQSSSDKLAQVSQQASSERGDVEQVFASKISALSNQVAELECALKAEAVKSNEFDTKLREIQQNEASVLASAEVLKAELHDKSAVIAAMKAELEEKDTAIAQLRVTETAISTPATATIVEAVPVAEQPTLGLCFPLLISF
jgi:chromosome segregation ATPase